jgi:hypothetical protein
MMRTFMTRRVAGSRDIAGSLKGSSLVTYARRQAER